MNQTDIVEIMSKRTTQIAMLSVVFVGMMVFLVLSLIEEAQARTDATVFTPNNIRLGEIHGTMEKGFFSKQPRYRDGMLTWQTIGTSGFGSELGSVTAVIPGQPGKITFSFSNPMIGSNSCDAVSENPNYRAVCWISGGIVAEADFALYDKSQQNTNNLCDILTKFGGIKQTEVIREKLHC